MKVTGKNVVVYINDGGTLKLYACATSAELTLVTEVIETSVSGSGKFATFLPTKNSFTGKLDGVTTLDEPTMLSLADLRRKQITQEILLVKFQRTAGANVYISEGNFIITESDDIGGYDDMNTYSISLQGTGPLSENTGDPVPPIVAFGYYYGLTDLDTVVDVGSSFPTETDFVDSVNYVFDHGGAIGYSEANSGESIDVESFGITTSDKVKFLQAPGTQPFFTLWSEVGNPFQQNQPIDASFNPSSGNVWFKTARGVNALYMTYSQTTFSGTLIFSR